MSHLGYNIALCIKTICSERSDRQDKKKSWFSIWTAATCNGGSTSECTVFQNITDTLREGAQTGRSI